MSKKRTFILVSLFYPPARYKIGGTNAKTPRKTIPEITFPLRESTSGSFQKPGTSFPTHHTSKTNPAYGSSVTKTNMEKSSDKTLQEILPAKKLAINLIKAPTTGRLGSSALYLAGELPDGLETWGLCDRIRPRRWGSCAL